MHLEHILLVTIALLAIVYSKHGNATGRVSFASNMNSPFGNIKSQFKQQQPLKPARKMPLNYSMKTTVQHGYYEKPRAKPKQKSNPVQETAPPSAPSPPVAAAPVPEPTKEASDIVPWDKKMLIEHVIASYKDSCKSSDIVIFPPETRHMLVASAKKMPVNVDKFPWVMNVEMFCTLNFWRVHSCFNMPLEDGFKKAMATHGINFTENSGAHGSVCSLIRKLESDELKESRSVHDNGLKNTLADILLDEFHSTRSLPHPIESFTISFSLKGATDAYWTLATKIEQFNKHFTKQQNDLCHAFHSNGQLYDHVEKITSGTNNTKLDDAFRNIKNVMTALPLEKANANERTADDCTYDLFLFRAYLELFLALDTSVIDWLSKHSDNFNYFCHEKLSCLYGRLTQKIRSTKKVSEALIKILQDWFSGRTHGRINDDFKYFEGTYVSGRFRIKIPPPKPESMQLKYSFQKGGVQNKVIYEHDGKNKMRMHTTVFHPKHGKLTSTNEMYMPKAAFPNPNNFTMHHQFNGVHGDISEEGGEEAEHMDNEQEHEEQGMSDEEGFHDQGMHSQINHEYEMNHEYDQYHPYGGMPESASFEMSNEMITDKKGKTRNVINNRCRIGQNHMNFQFGYDPECTD